MSMTSTGIDPQQHDTKLAALYWVFAKLRHTESYQRDRIVRSAGVVALVAALIFPGSAAAAWPTWGNIEHGDCAFAAAANWEMLHGGTNATEESIIAEWHEQNGDSDEGTSADELEAFWAHHGIGGRKVVIHERSTERLRQVFSRNGPVIAEFAVVPGQRWAPANGPLPYPVDETGGIHWIVVRYIDKRGPVILTWGELAQLTWWQWNEDSMLLYTGRILG